MPRLDSSELFKRQPDKIVKHTQKIRRLLRIHPQESF